MSGISSGAFFAVQMLVAYSSKIAGLGIIAGGPFYCANDNVEIALNACMKYPAFISLTELETITFNVCRQNWEGKKQFKSKKKKKKKKKN